MKNKKIFIILSSFFMLTSCVSTAAVLIANKIISNQTNQIKNEAKTFTLKFNANGGILTGQASLTIKEGEKFSTLTNVPSVSRDGAGSNPGWYYTKLSGQKVVVNADTTFEGDETLIANWTTYHVTFNPGEGSFKGSKDPININDTTYIHSDEVTTPSCDGKAFDGWYDSNNIKQTFPYTPHENTTLTAKFTTNIVSLGFSSTEGYFDSPSDTTRIVPIAYGKTWNELKQEGSLPSKPNYNGEKLFSSWKLNGVDINDNQQFTRTVLINASYEDAITCTFNVSSNNGKWSDESTSNKVSTKLALAAKPTFAKFKDAASVLTTTSITGNYELLGWFTDTYATSNAYKDDDVIKETHNFTVYAYYKVPHTISFVGTTDGYTVKEQITQFVRKDNIKYTINANNGYTLTSNDITVSWNGEVKTAGVDYAFTVNNNIGSLEIYQGPGYDVTVSITPSINSYNIYTSKGTGVSTLTVNSSATYKDSVTVTATAENGYTLNNIKILKKSDESLYATISSGGSFVMPYYEVIVVATATANTYNISKTSVTGVSSYTVVSQAQYNSSVSVVATASAGYTVNYIYIKQNGTTVQTITGSSGYFTMTLGDCTIEASVGKITYTISTTSVTGVSSYSVSGTKQVNETISVSATPSTGYKINYIYVYQGSSLIKTISGASGTFTMPAANCTVKADVSLISYTITRATISNCTISSNKSTANYNNSITITATPSSGFYVSRIEAKYTNSSGSTYAYSNFSQSTSARTLTFTMPASNMYVTATVTRCIYNINVYPQSNVSSLTTSPSGSAETAKSITVTASANSGYYISEIKVTNSSGTKIAGSTYTQSSGSKTLTFTMPNDSAVNVYAYASIWKYSITTYIRSGLSSYGGVPTTASAGTTITPTASSISGSSQNCYRVTYTNGTNYTSKSFGSGFTMPSSDIYIYNYLSSFTVNENNYYSGTLNLYFKKGTSNACKISSSGSSTSFVGYGLYGQSNRTNSTSYGWITVFKNLGLSGPAKGDADHYLYYFSGTSTGTGSFFTQTRKTTGSAGKEIGSDVNVYIESF